jgi:hypothetical protein
LPGCYFKNARTRANATYILFFAGMQKGHTP